MSIPARREHLNRKLRLRRAHPRAKPGRTGALRATESRDRKPPGMNPFGNPGRRPEAVWPYRLSPNGQDESVMRSENVSGKRRVPQRLLTATTAADEAQATAKLTEAAAGADPGSRGRHRPPGACPTPAVPGPRASARANKTCKGGRCAIAYEGRRHALTKYSVGY